MLLLLPSCSSTMLLRTHCTTTAALASRGLRLSSGSSVGAAALGYWGRSSLLALPGGVRQPPVQPGRARTLRTVALGGRKPGPKLTKSEELELATMRRELARERAEVEAEKKEMEAERLAVSMKSKAKPGPGMGFLPGSKAPPIPEEFKQPKKPAKQRKAEALKKELNLPVKEKPARAPSTAPVKRKGKMRLSVCLSTSGVASRRAAEDIIRAGRVKVNGEVADLPQTMVDPTKGDAVTVDDQPLSVRNPTMYYFAVNKPKGYICSNARQGNGKIVEDLFVDWRREWERKNARREDKIERLPPRLVAVGRLDSATTGLLLVTNDGVWAQKVAHPRNGVTKEYIVTSNKPVTQRQLRTIQAGCEVTGKHVKPLVAELLLDSDRSNASRSRVQVVVSEGRHHEVRELLKNAGVEVKQLKRTRIGGLRLGGIGLGQVQELQPNIVKRVLDLGLQNNC